MGVDSDFLSYCFGLSIDEQFEGLSPAREREREKNMNLFICIFGFLCIVDVYFNGFCKLERKPQHSERCYDTGGSFQRQ